MKKWSVLLIGFLFILAACGEKTKQEAPKKEVKKPPVKEVKKVDPRVEKLAQFAKDLQANAKKGIEIPMEKCEELAQSLKLVLPPTTGELAGMEWTDLSCSKGKDEGDMLFTANLNRKSGDTSEQCMWFHILYNPHLSQEERDNYGDEDVGGFKASRSQNAHLWVLVNNMELRGVAESKDYQDDAKIRVVLENFALKDIAKL